ncbi:MAG: hypothetical protein COT81_05205 [Candidatus Buchananbacteria bacterium CG10_big_fil_rev_8_21_14_0_10_42_9]|uniref:ABC transporter permease n=1 Tax=Candidatus Buchananbacteria bacterium CG10_big_fil_rev_8_21_14_0_10_42_9 TaxID=1974526 RepID=A0A2H0W011_9BACT|nr:MAG: hypothetical protein COT81_05205 [Candidatus Buchananbacteria bacterium CG10_big_fil_rev_8_21_14_0_10_42_9]
MIKNFLRLSLKGIRHRRLRSWLTILGVVIGIMLVVVILSISSGVRSVVSGTLQMFASDLITVVPGEETNPFIAFYGGQKFKESDVYDLEKISGIDFVVPMNINTFTAEFKGEQKTVMVHGAPFVTFAKAYETSEGFTIASGNWPASDETNEIVLGHNLATELFKQDIKLNDEIILKSKKMRVIGILQDSGEQIADNVLHVSDVKFRELTGAGLTASVIKVKLLPKANIDLVSRQIEHELSKQQEVRDFSVISPQKADQVVGNVLNIVELSLVVIGLISLIVGSVNIMNTMYTSVVERTKQIGIMKAVGASSDSILSLFLIESGLIGLVGGVLGVIFGVGLAYVMGSIAARYGVVGLFSFSSLDYFGLFIILIVTFIVGVLSGVLPARQAAKLEPATALRK